MAKSSNFGFLDRHDPMLLDLALRAERNCFSDPVVCLVRVRQLIEAIALQVVSALGDFPPAAQQRDLSAAIGFLQNKGVMANEAAQVFHLLHKAGNIAVHENRGSKGDTLHALRFAQRAAIWFHRTISDPTFKSPVFVPPPEPARASESLADELRALREQLAKAEAAAATAAITATEEKSRREAAEQAARKAYEDLEAAMSLAEEAEKSSKAPSRYFGALLRVPRRTRPQSRRHSHVLAKRTPPSRKN